jgi:ATP-dependent Clp protease ATP-binding subunit ClpA
MGPFDRFNDRAKRVLALAQDEAIRFNHNYIGVEHLLLGLVREGEGVAARVLESLGVELSKVRTAVESLIGRGDSTTTPSQITLSPRTKKVIELAIDESRKLGHSAVATEHLLLGVVREGGSMANHVLNALGVDSEKIRVRVFATLGQAPPVSAAPTYGAAEAHRSPERFDDVIRRVIALAENEALGLGHTWVGTEHLVLGLISTNGTRAQAALQTLGVTLDAARQLVAKLPPPNAEWRTPELTMTFLARRLLQPQPQQAGPHTPQELLLAIVGETESQGTELLAALGTTAEKVRDALDKARE